MTTIEVRTSLPHWDLTPIFPALDSADFDAAFSGLERAISALKETFDEHEIRKRPTDIDDSTVGVFNNVIERLNALYDSSRKINSFLYALVTTDAKNDLAQAKLSQLLMHTAELNKLEIRLDAWIGSLDTAALIERSKVARDHEFYIRRSLIKAQHQMSEAEEELAASLNQTGHGAWSRLHGNLTSRVVVDVPMPDGEAKRVPMAAIPGLMEDPDPRVRRCAYDAANATWPTYEVPLAAALNSIKGWRNEIDGRRGWADSVEPSLFANNVDRATLDALQQACIDAFPDFRRFLLAKAKLLGKERLASWDFAAPVAASTRSWEWDETATFIVEQFGTYSDRLANLAARAFLERWIDAEPREGKQGGGFCMGVQNDESRVLVNFTKTFQAVTTVAHELGHAYHNLNLAERTAIQRQTPMSLAETASTFCETIVGNALLSDADAGAKLGLLNGDLIRDTLICVAIHYRFLFEKAVYDRRREHELSATELTRLMEEKQREVWGDAVDPNALQPYAWCVTPHYYGGLPYYNWPYTFGLLFGLGLYKRFQDDPDGFRATYDELLSSTGMADAAALCARFDIDVRSPDFWRSSLDVTRSRIDEFVRLAEMPA